MVYIFHYSYSILFPHLPPAAEPRGPGPVFSTLVTGFVTAFVSRCFLHPQWMLTKSVHASLAEGLWGLLPPRSSSEAGETICWAPLKEDAEAGRICYSKFSSLTDHTDHIL